MFVAFTQSERVLIAAPLDFLVSLSSCSLWRLVGRLMLSALRQAPSSRPRVTSGQLVSWGDVDNGTAQSYIIVIVDELIDQLTRLSK